MPLSSSLPLWNSSKRRKRKSNNTNKSNISKCRREVVTVLLSKKLAN
jgi:hypothetical protein